MIHSRRGILRVETQVQCPFCDGMTPWPAHTPHIVCHRCSAMMHVEVQLEEELYEEVRRRKMDAAMDLARGTEDVKDWKEPYKQGGGT